jgi:hypothetical protein
MLVSVAQLVIRLTAIRSPHVVSSTALHVDFAYDHRVHERRSVGSAA